MVSMKFLFILIIAFLVAPIDGKCRKKRKSICKYGENPLPGVFCGRGPTHQDCPYNYECVIAPNDAYAMCCLATKEEPQPSPCADGSSPLPNVFCGRGPTHQDCPYNSECVIAPNDAYAVCCPNGKVEKPGLCPKPSGKIGICLANCTSDSNCEGALKCCGSCPRLCVEPVGLKKINIYSKVLGWNL